MAKFTRPQREAMALLEDMRHRYADEAFQGEATSGATRIADLGATWPALIHWKTADALARHGLVKIYRHHDGWDIELTQASGTDHERDDGLHAKLSADVTAAAGCVRAGDWVIEPGRIAVTEAAR